MSDSYAVVSSSLKKSIDHDFPTDQSVITNDETIFQKFEIKGRPQIKGNILVSRGKNQA